MSNLRTVMAASILAAAAADFSAPRERPSYKHTNTPEEVKAKELKRQKRKAQKLARRRSRQ